MDFDSYNKDEGNDDDEESKFGLPKANSGGDDDDEPPAAGACAVAVESRSPSAGASLAPTAEPNHTVAPRATPMVA